MIRVIHSQTTHGPLLLADIDDGLRFQSKIHHDSSRRKILKQSVYVHYTNPNDVTEPGYVDLIDSDKALLSLNHGTIAGLVAGGYASIQLFPESALATPHIDTAQVNVPNPGDLTVVAASNGRFLSIPPDVSSLVITGTGAITLTKTQVTTGGGTWTDNSIWVPTTLLVVPIAAGTSSVKVIADDNASNLMVVA